MIIQLLSAIVTSVICILLHIIFCLIIPARLKFSSDIKRLIFQGKMLLAIWLIMLPLFFTFNNIFTCAGMETLIEEKGISKLLSLIYSIILFVCLFFIYITIYYIIDRSVSCRIMIEIEKSPYKKLSFNQLIKVYDVDIKYQDEINGMLEGGFIKKDGAKYKCTTRGLIIAYIAYFFKKIFKLGKGG